MRKRLQGKDQPIDSKVSRRLQHGYLLEVPIILLLVGIVVAVLFPGLEPMAQKILLGIAVVPVLFCLYYMIVIPGWMPGDNRRLRPPWNFVAFVIMAAAIIGGVLLFVFSG